MSMIRRAAAVAAEPIERARLGSMLGSRSQMWLHTNTEYSEATDGTSEGNGTVPCVASSGAARRRAVSRVRFRIEQRQPSCAMCDQRAFDRCKLFFVAKAYIPTDCRSNTSYGLDRMMLKVAGLYNALWALIIGRGSNVRV